MSSNAAPHALATDVYLRAATVGRSAAGVSGPNPPVGCIILRDGLVVSEGATAAAGGPHAEIVALAKAGDAARGATVVVTLEPCAHHGRTGPCTDALIEAGVASVHVIIRDPDPVAAGGIERLRAAGITVVEVGPIHPDVAALVAFDLRGFVTRVHSGRPHVTLKIAQTPDGRTEPGPSGYLTGLEARTRVHRLRAEVDAVLVGSGTIRADDPRLDVRHVLAPRSPRPVVLATNADVDAQARVIRSGALVVVGDSADDVHCATLERAGATIVRIPTTLTSPRGRLDLARALGVLPEHRILTVLAEPGPALAEALLAAGLVDEVEVHVARPAGHRSIVPALPRLAPLVSAWNEHAHTVEAITLGEDVVLRPSSSLLSSLLGPRSVASAATAVGHRAEVA